MQGTETIMDWLKAKQAQLGERDGAFAARLGVTRQMWQMARTGKALPGAQMLRGAVVAFPELYAAVQSVFLPGNASILTPNGKHTAGVAR